MTRAAHVHERLAQAVRTLALGRGHINDRLAAAYGVLADLHPTDWPDPLQPAAAALHQRVTAGVGPLGDSTATTQTMSEDEAVDLAAQILDLEARLRG